MENDIILGILDTLKVNDGYVGAWEGDVVETPPLDLYMPFLDHQQAHGYLRPQLHIEQS